MIRQTAWSLLYVMEREVGMEGWGFPISWSLSALLRGSVNSHQVGVALEVPL